MKKCYLLVLLLSAPILMNAQISLTAAMAPPHGSMFIYYDANVPSPAFTFSKSGTSNTWDFTTIAPLPIEEDSTFIVDPTSIPGSSVFPTSTHSIRNHDEPLHTMIEVTSTNVIFLGVLGDVLGTGTNLAGVVNPPLTAMTFPYTYGSSVNGNSNIDLYVSGAIIGQPAIDSIHFKSNIVQTHDVIAAGNIIIPSGTFASLLERQISTTIDSAWIKSILTGNMWIPAPGFPTTFTDSAFNWYTDQSLQKYAHALYDSTGLHDVVFFKSSTVGTHELQSQNESVVYPNPVMNTLYLRNSGQPGMFQLKIFDITGKEIMHGSGNTDKINVSLLVPGIYFVKITSGNGESVTHRFVKE